MNGKSYIRKLFKCKSKIVNKSRNIKSFLLVKLLNLTKAGYHPNNWNILIVHF